MSSYPQQPNSQPSPPPTGILPEGVDFADDSEQTPFYKFQQAFQSQFGRPLDVTGDTANNPMHRTPAKRDAFDVRTKNLQPEHLSWMDQNLSNYGLKAIKSTGQESWSTGPHWHLEPIPGFQSQTAQPGILPEGVEFADDEEPTPAAPANPYAGSKAYSNTGSVSTAPDTGIPARFGDANVKRLLPKLGEITINAGPPTEKPITPKSYRRIGGATAIDASSILADYQAKRITPEEFKAQVTQLYATQGLGFEPWQVPVARQWGAGEHEGYDPFELDATPDQLAAQIGKQNGRLNIALSARNAKILEQLRNSPLLNPEVAQAERSVPTPKQQPPLASDIQSTATSTGAGLAQLGSNVAHYVVPALTGNASQLLQRPPVSPLAQTLSEQAQAEAEQAPGPGHQIVRGVAQGAFQLPEYLLAAEGGPLGFAGLGAAEQAHRGPAEAAKSAAMNALIGGALHAGSELPIGVQAPYMAGVGAAPPYLEAATQGATPGQAALAAIPGAVQMGLLPLAGLISRERGAAKPEVQDFAEAQRRLGLPPAPPEVLAQMARGPFEAPTEGPAKGKYSAERYKRPNLDVVGKGSEGVQIPESLKVQVGVQPEAATPPTTKPADVIYHRDLGLPLLRVGEQGNAWVVKNPRTGNTYPISKALTEEPSGKMYLKGSGEPLNVRQALPDGIVEAWHENGSLERFDPRWLDKEKPEWRREIAVPYSTKENAEAAAARYEVANPNTTTKVTPATSRRGYQWFWKEGRSAEKPSSTTPTVQPNAEPVRASGKELTLYHGTDGEFKARDGMYLTDSRSAAKAYGEKVTKLKVTMRNPYTITEDGGPDFYDILGQHGIEPHDNFFEQLGDRDVREVFRKLGYDGFITDGDSPDFGNTTHTVYIPFDAASIASDTKPALGATERGGTPTVPEETKLPPAGRPKIGMDTDVQNEINRRLEGYQPAAVTPELEAARREALPSLIDQKRQSELPGMKSGVDVIRGSTNIPLAPEGVQQAREIGAKLAAKGGLDVLYGNEQMERVRQTKDGIAESNPNLQRLDSRDAFDPWYLGQHEGRPTQDVLDEMHRLIKNPQIPAEGRGEASTKPGESFGNFRDRFVGGLREAMADYEDNPQKVGVVTHYRDLKMLEAWLKKGVTNNRFDEAHMLAKGDDPPGTVLKFAPDANGKWGLERISLDDKKPLENGIYFIRHGMTAWNGERGAANVPTEQGVAKGVTPPTKRVPPPVVQKPTTGQRVENVIPQSATPQEAGEFLRKKYGQETTGTAYDRRTGNPLKVLGQEGEAYKVQNTQTGKTYNIHRNAVDEINAEQVPDIHREMQQSGLDARQRLDAFKAMRMEFKDPVQMTGTVRGIDAATGRQPSTIVQYRSGGRNLDYTVVGRFPGGEKLMVLTPDAQTRIIQSPFGETGNTRIKGADRLAMGKVPEIDWPDVGLLSDVHPTMADVRRVNPNATRLSDLSDAELQKHFPQVYKNIHDAEGYIGEKAAKEAIDQSMEGAEKEPEFVQKSRDRLRQGLSGNTLSANPIHALYDTAIITGWDAYKAGKYTADNIKEWTKDMVERLGERVRPYLEDVWSKLHNEAPQWYSPLENAVKLRMPNKASAEQVKGILRSGGFIVKGEGGIERPNDEAHWTGLYDFLQRKSSAKEPVTKQEVLDYLAKNRVELQERQFGGQGTPEYAAARQRLEAAGYITDVVPGADPSVVFVRRGAAPHSDFLTADEMPLRIRRDARLIAGSLEKQEGLPRFTQWTTPGGENHRELTLSLPIDRTPLLTLELPDGFYVAQEDGKHVVRDRQGRRFTSADTPDDAIRKYIQQQGGLGPKGGYVVPGAHAYGIPEADTNRIALLRVNDRVGPSGEKILHLDEYQDDLQNDIQRLKKKLSETPEDTNGWTAEFDDNARKWIVRNQSGEVEGETRSAPTPQDAIMAVGGTGNKQSVAQELQRLEPLLPFRGKSHELAMKRVLDYGVRNGYDKISWATGQQVADRYSLSEQLDSLGWNRNENGTYDLRGYQGETSGRTPVIDLRDIQASRLPDYVGKELAQRIDGSSEAAAVYKGIDLKIGGEGKKTLYDNLIPNFLSKYTKRWGGKVGETQIHIPFTGELQGREGESAIDALNRQRQGENVSVHSLDITPEMKASILKTGQPLFGMSEGEPPMVVDARARLAESMSGKHLNMNPVQDMADMALITGYKTYQLARKFGGWSNQMIKQLGNQVRPHLESTYAKIKMLMDVESPNQEGAVSLGGIKIKGVSDEATNAAKEFFDRGGSDYKTFQSYMKVNLGEKYTPALEKNLYRVFQQAEIAKRKVAGQSSGRIPKGMPTDLDIDEAIPPTGRTEQPIGTRGPTPTRQSYQEGEEGPEPYEAPPQTMKQWWQGASPIRRAIDIANIPRTMIATGNLHAVFRQGDIFSLTEPVQGLAKPAKDMLKAFFMNKENYKEAQKQLALHPDFQRLRDTGVEFTGHGLGRSEEAFMSRLAHKIPWVRSSDQAFTTFLNSQRLNVGSKYFHALDDAGKDFNKDPKPYYDMARWVNAATGRGDLGQINEAWKEAANAVFFSPRYIKSRLDVLNPKTYTDMDPATRKIALKKMFEYTGVLATTLGMASLAGAKVTLNPEDSDFGKVVVGNTHYDLTAGLAPYVRQSMLMSKYFMASQMKKGADSMLHFLRGRLAPAPGVLVNLYQGKDVTGKEATPLNQIAQLITPMFFKDAYEGWKDSGAIGVAKASPAFFGMSSHTYETKEPKTGMEKNLLERVRAQHGDAVPPEDTKARIDAEKQISDAIKAGKHQDAQKLYETHVEKGVLPPGKDGADNATVNRIKDRAQLTPLQYLVKHNPSIDLEAALDAFLDNKSTDSERKEIAPIILEKEESFEKAIESGRLPKTKVDSVMQKIERAKQAGIWQMAAPRAANQ